MTGALIFYRNSSVTNIAQSVLFSTGGDSCTIRSFNIINKNNYPVYLKFYDMPSGSITIGTSTITGTLLIPNGGVFENSAFLIKDLDENTTEGGGRYLNFNTAISIACTKNLSDSDNSSPGNSVYVELQYQKI